MTVLSLVNLLSESVMFQSINQESLIAAITTGIVTIVGAISAAIVAIIKANKRK